MRPELVLFAKLYDIAPDGARTLVHRLVAPVRVPDVTEPVTVVSAPDDTGLLRLPVTGG
ncbi:hypothetical protein AB0K93_31090 [Streptomyces sp. NPDC052676]|uniref:hypothetical protein n=1 Tax=Streptomyces sp. NPDC052676 TaxID=3154953 RepID=UPI003424860F